MTTDITVVNIIIGGDRMKGIKRLLTVIFTFVVVFAVTYSIRFVFSEIKLNADTINRVGFGREELSINTEEKFLTLDEIKNEELIADDYRTSFHYDKLEAFEQDVYKVLKYAAEKGYTYIYFEDGLSFDSNTAIKVVYFLALDSPFIEQNLKLGTGTFTTSYDVKLFKILPTEKAVKGSYIFIKDFDCNQWEKKLSALKAAEKVVGNLDKNSSDFDRAEKLYKYVLEHVDYYDYSDKPTDYLETSMYDGFFGGKTHCDGTANMYSLLANMAGIDCIEKMYSNEDDEAGHTWNMIKIEDKWYNVDATAGLDKNSTIYNILTEVRFCFADSLQKFTPNHNELYEPSTSLKVKIDAHYPEVYHYTLMKTVENNLKKNKSTLILFDNYDETKFKRAIQAVVDKNNYSITHSIIEGNGGKTAVLVVRK